VRKCNKVAFKAAIMQHSPLKQTLISEPPPLIPLMHAPQHPANSIRPNAALCSSALSRLGWATAALLLLWSTVYWALS